MVLQQNLTGCIDDLVVLLVREEIEQNTPYTISPPAVSLFPAADPQ
jgi:hypothetical protein